MADVLGFEVTECGHGPNVVLVHGSGSDQRTWRGQRERWCDLFHLVTYSRRYHHPNPPIPPGRVYALEEHVADLAALVEELELGSATLVGHSYGGVVSLVLAARRPELVERLVLAEPPVLGLFGSVPPSPLQLLGTALRHPRIALGILKLGAGSMDPAEAALKRGDRDEAVRRLGTGILGEEAFEALSPERRQQVEDNLMLEELQSVEALPRLDPDTVSAVRCPVLLLGGARSPTIFSHLLGHLQTLLPHARRVTIPGASHILHEDAPEAFHRAVEEFLDA